MIDFISFFFFYFASYLTWSGLVVIKSTIAIPVLGTSSRVAQPTGLLQMEFILDLRGGTILGYCAGYLMSIREGEFSNMS